MEGLGIGPTGCGLRSRLGFGHTAREQGFQLGEDGGLCRADVDLLIRVFVEVVELDTGTVVSYDARRLLQTVAAIAAAAGQQWDKAEEHYKTALRQADEIPFRSEQPEARRWYAQMLIDRNAPGDRDKARTLLSEAVEMYRTIGMPKHLEMVAKMSAEL